MAKNPFDEVLELVTDDGDKKALTELATKYSSLKDGWLRQSDYSRSMDSVKKLQKELDAAKGKIELADRWDAWRAENWDEEANATRAEAVLKAQLESERQAKLELEAKLASGGEMSPQEIETVLEQLAAKKNWISKAEAEKELAVLRQQAQGSLAVGLKAGPVAVRHYRVFNEEPNMDELVKFAAENGHNDLEQAYNSWVAPRLKELDDKKRAEEIEQVKKEAYEKAKQEFAAQRGMSPDVMPDETDAVSTGALDVLMGNRPEGLPNAKLGSGQFARAAANMDWSKSN